MSDSILDTRVLVMPTSTMKHVLFFVCILLTSCVGNNSHQFNSRTANKVEYPKLNDTAFFVGVAFDTNYVLNLDTSYSDTIKVVRFDKDSISILLRMKNINWQSFMPIWERFKIAPNHFYKNGAGKSFEQYHFSNDSLQLNIFFGAIGNEKMGHMSKTFSGKRQ